MSEFVVGARVVHPRGRGEVVWHDRDYGTIRLDDQWLPIVVQLEHCTVLPAVPPPLPERWAVLLADGIVYSYISERSARQCLPSAAIVHVWTDESGDHATVERTTS